VTHLTAHRINRLGIKWQPRNQRRPGSSGNHYAPRLDQRVAEPHATYASTLDMDRANGRPAPKRGAFSLSAQGHCRKQLLRLDLRVLRNAQRTDGLGVDGRLLAPEVIRGPAIAANAVSLKARHLPVELRQPLRGERYLEHATTPEPHIDTQEPVELTGELGMELSASSPELKGRCIVVGFDRRSEDPCSR